MEESIEGGTNTNTGDDVDHFDDTLDDLTVEDEMDDDIFEDTNNNTTPDVGHITDVSPTEITDDVPQFQYHLFVHIKAGHDLPPKKQNGSSDPYVKFLMNGKTVHRSKTIHKDLNPNWDESFMASVPDLSRHMEIRVSL